MISIQYSDDPRLRKAQKFGVYTVLGLGAFVIFGTLFGWLIQWLWNATLTEMFGWSSITFWQAIGLFVLAKLFFGFGAGSSSSGRSGRGRRRRKSPGEPASETQSEVAGLSRDDAFVRFWQEQGRDAYAEFRAASGADGETRGPDPDTEPDDVRKP